MTAFLPASDKIIAERVDNLRTAALPMMFWLTTRRQPAFDGPFLHADMWRDGAWRHALVAQSADFRIAIVAGDAARFTKSLELCRSGPFGLATFGRSSVLDFRYSLTGRLDKLAMPTNGSSQGIAEIAQKMPAISYLYGIRRTATRTVGIKRRRSHGR